MNDLKILFFLLFLCITSMAESDRVIKKDLLIQQCYKQKIANEFGQSCDFSSLSVDYINKVQQQCLNQISQNTNQNINIDPMTNKGLDHVITILLNNTAIDCHSNQRFSFLNDNLVSTTTVNEVTDQSQVDESEVLATYPLSIDGYNPLIEGDYEEASE